VRIFVHDHSGHGFQVELSRALAAAGHQVRHAWCSSFSTPHGALEVRPGDPEGFSVVGIDHGEPFDKYHAVRRTRQELRYVGLFAGEVRAFAPDVVISANAPLLTQRGISRWCRTVGLPQVLWLQDVYSVAMGLEARRRLGPAGATVARLLTEAERTACREASAVVAIAEAFRPFLAEAGVPDDRVEVIENWAPLRELPTVFRDNRWAVEQGLADRDVVLYSGTLGLKHDPELLLRVARALDDRPAPGTMVVVSEGLGAEWLRQRAVDEELASLRVLPFQPHQHLAEVLGTADVLTAILEPDAGAFSVPSKVLTYHCAGRPIVGAIPAANLAAQTIQRAGSGVVVDPTDRDGFTAATVALLDDGLRRGALGHAARQHAEAAFDLDHITERFQAVLHDVVRRGLVEVPT
jgi:glycosyltransferase involved in cell wall biosynthesis